jgi:hypothetical protein
LNSIDRILAPLTAYQGEESFNPYRHSHPRYDLPHAPAIRQANLRRFLETFSAVRVILLAEAAGYQGCRFSGIPMTSEDHLVGLEPVHWAAGGGYHRSSTRDRLWREPSATILWETLGRRMDCLIWNTFPWHPMGKRGPLSNRTPRAAEIQAGLPVLAAIRERYPTTRLVAIGRVAERTLRGQGIETHYIRHPAHGGKNDFVAGINALR